MKLNKLTINYKKTKYMLFTNRKGTKNRQVFIGTNKIEQVSEIKYLGVLIDDKLSWKCHIQYICSKL